MYPPIGSLQYRAFAANNTFQWSQMRSLSLALYRALLMTVDRTAQTYPALSHITLREPVYGEIGSSSTGSTAAAYLLESLESLVPGCEVPAQEPNLSWKDVKRLIRANFDANKGVTQASSIKQLADQAFMALRAVPHLAYLEACSSTNTTEGVVIEATSCYSDKDPAAGIGGPGFQQPRSFFKYRIRIINQRPHPIKVLGRHWIIQHEDGTLEAMVKLSEDNGIVGQQPVIMPGGCFQYYSVAHLTNTGQEVPRGSMKGDLLVDLFDEQAAAASARVVAAVGPFPLMPPPTAAEAAAS